MGDLYSISGSVTKIVRTNYNKTSPEVVFIIKRPDDAAVEEITCPFFFPVHVNDVVECIVRRTAPGKLIAVQLPFGQASVDPYNIQVSFVSALQGSRFGPGKAEKLYDELKRQADELGYGERHTPTSAVTTDPFNSQYVVTSQQSRYKGDGVIPYLSEMAGNFIKGDRMIVPSMVDGTGLSSKQMSHLLYWWHKNRSMRRLYLLGLNNSEIRHCRLPLDEIYEKCCSNPYVLAGVPIEKCVTIMRIIHETSTPEQIERGRILRKVDEHSTKRGWTSTPIGILRKEFPKLDTHIAALQADYFLVFDCNMVYLKHIHHIETYLTTYFDKKILETAKVYQDRATCTPPSLALFKENLTDEQRAAVNGAIISKISIITGGGGVGKTLSLSEIARNRIMAEQTVAITAFTGKAVSRINEVMGSNAAMTMDRMISTYHGTFDHLIIDEASMVTMELMYRFVQKFPGDYRITLVGDCNQLPPITWGSLMQELLNSNRVPVFYLTKNHRVVSVDGSTGDSFQRAILDNANELIRRTRSLDRPLKFKDGPGFTSIEGDDRVIEHLVRQLHTSGIPIEKIMIICPYNDKIRELNELVQKIYLAEALATEGMWAREVNGKTWCVGDRIMMLQNNYAIGVMNGDEGWIVKTTTEGVTAKYRDEVEHFFRFWVPDHEDELLNLYAGNPEDADDDVQLHTAMVQHSFDITVHKSQGSERDYVIVYIPKRTTSYGTSSFVNINLLYTAITRAKKMLWLIGDERTIEAATVQPLPKRWDLLAARLRGKRIPDLESVMQPLTKPPVITTSIVSSNSLAGGTECFEEDDLLSPDDLEALYE